jgi:PAS domain S-box-containing protein
MESKDKKCHKSDPQTADFTPGAEKKFRQLFESMNEGCALHRVIYDDQGQAVDYDISDVNPAYEIILGLTRNQVIGKKSSEVYGSSNPPYLEVYSEVAATGKSCAFETYFPPMQKYFKVSAFSLEKGYFATVFSDITAHKRAEEALSKERDKLDLITSNIGIGLTIISRDYRILWANQVLRDDFGEVEGRPCYAAYNGNPEVCPGCGVKEVFEEGKSRVMHEQKGRNLQGQTVWSQIVATPIKDENGRIMEALEAVMPITARKQAEEALRESEAFNASLLDNAPNPVLVYNPDLTIRYVNRAFEELTGFTGAEAAGRKEPFPWWPPDKYAEYAYDNIHTRIKEADTLKRQILKKSGEPIWVAISVTHVKDQDGVKFYLSTWVDITENRRREESLKEEVEMRARFIDVLAHELKSPLSPILSSAGMLKDILAKDRDGTLTRLAANVYQSTQILSRRLDELLDLARYSRGAFVLNTRPTEMAAYIANAGARYQPSVELSKHKLVVTIPDRLPVMEIDPSRMEQVLINLLSNAVKYSPAGARIELRAHTADGRLRIEVQDEGRGLSATDAQNLFKPYHRLEKDRHKSAGLGLGLVICKHIVEAHGGQIEVFSQVGQGSTFRISLPIPNEKK